ncbi:MAG: phosphohydrolase [Leptospiraceae bacterium]|nr:MAG: phosphohydrolase [Leptospiraceae bacterium]
MLHINIKTREEKIKNIHPYINHPIDVLNVLVNEAKIDDIEILVAGILHDTIEDTQTTYEELKELFGENIANIVLEVTDDKSLPKHIRKEKQITNAKYKSYKAKIIKIADKICNLRDIMNSPPENWSIERKKEYFFWAKKVIDEIRGTHSILENTFDKEYEKINHNDLVN